MRKFAIVSAAAAVLGLASVSNAAFTNLNWWRMGEDPIAATDSGFSHAAAAYGAELDWVSGNSASTPAAIGLRVRAQGVAGGATYSSEVPSDPKAAGSTFSVDLPNTPGQTNTTGTASLGRNATFTTPTTNFGGEIWFKPDTLDTNLQTLFYIGSSAQILPVYISATAGGAPQVSITVKNNGGFTWTNPGGSKPLAVGQWNHLAVVLEDTDADLTNGGGSVKLYMNGVLEPTSKTLTVATDANDNNYFIGATPGYSLFFDGKVDEARVFTFNPGQFDASTDLLVTVPEPTMIGLMGLSVLGLIRRRRA